MHACICNSDQAVPFQNQYFSLFPLLIAIYIISSPQVGFQAIAEALGMAAVKAIVAIAAIIAGGRLVRLCLEIQIL